MCTHAHTQYMQQMRFMGTCLCDTYVHLHTICANAISHKYPINTESNVVHCVNNGELAAAIPAPIEPNLHVREKALQFEHNTDFKLHAFIYCACPWRWDQSMCIYRMHCNQLAQTQPH